MSTIADWTACIGNHHEPARDDRLDNPIAEAIAWPDHVVLSVWTLRESHAAAVHSQHAAHGDLVRRQSGEPVGR
jgi:hypothetical protein